jgi:hypothetical protein
MGIKEEPFMVTAMGYVKKAAAMANGAPAGRPLKCGSRQATVIKDELRKKRGRIAPK